MKLDAFDGNFGGAEANDDAVAGLSGDLKLAGEGFSLDDQRVVAGCCERIGQLLEDPFAVVMDFTGLPVKESGRADDFSAEGNSDRLMTQANTQNRKFSCDALDELDGDDRLLRRARCP